MISGDDEVLHANSPEQFIITTKAIIKAGDLHRMYFVLMSRSGCSWITAVQKRDCSIISVKEEPGG